MKIKFDNKYGLLRFKITKSVLEYLYGKFEKYFAKNYGDEQ